MNQSKTVKRGKEAVLNLSVLRPRCCRSEGIQSRPEKRVRYCRGAVIVVVVPILNVVVVDE